MEKISEPYNIRECGLLLSYVKQLKSRVDSHFLVLLLFYVLILCRKRKRVRTDGFLHLLN